MGKKKSPAATRSTSSVTLREESSGKKQSNVNAKSMLKLDHLKRLAIWASSEASIPSLGAVFGHHLAATAEALGVAPDPSLFSCQRCESILQPGYNCTVRIEKLKAKAKQRRKKKPSVSTQNNVVYNCHFCSHQNLKRGTPKGYMKQLCPPKAKLPSKPEISNLNGENFDKVIITASKDDTISKVGGIASQEITVGNPVNSSPMTPTPMTKVGALLDMNKRKRNRSGSMKTAEPGNNSVPTDAEKASIAPSKRKRKSWTSLKDIAERNEQNFATLSIPFHI
ncbi:hypothetical protein ACH5RR_041572 [Cinchona calisaya]|uniref:Uncharacterized protein n=1 Tax=Cinchona calisaya TaxID=153742 RepID=A0ABD2XXX7_9GENT